MKLAAVCAAGVLLAAGAGCGGGTLDAKAVRVEAAGISSLATQGGLIARELERGRMLESFAQVHAADLAADAAKARDALRPELATPGTRAAVERLGRLAERAAVELRGIETRPRDGFARVRLRAALERVAREAAGIEGRL